MSNQWLLLAMAGKRTKAAKARAMKAIRDTVKKAEVATLEGVTFASTRAAELAEEADLSWRDFAGSLPSSCRGFTADDVRAAAELRETDA